MTEWGVVGVIVVLVGLVGTVVKAAVSMTKSVQKNTDATERLADIVGDFKKDNKTEHREFREQLGDHETRISVLEHTDRP